MSPSPHPSPRRPGPSQGAVSSFHPAAAAHSAREPGPENKVRSTSSGSREVEPPGATAMPGAAGVLLVLLLSGGLGGGRAQRLRQRPPQAHQQRGTGEERALGDRLSGSAAPRGTLPTAVGQEPRPCFCRWGVRFGATGAKLDPSSLSTARVHRVGEIVHPQKNTGAFHCSSVSGTTCHLNILQIDLQNLSEGQLFTN